MSCHSLVNLFLNISKSEENAFSSLPLSPKNSNLVRDYTAQKDKTHGKQLPRLTNHQSMPTGWEPANGFMIHSRLPTYLSLMGKELMGNRLSYCLAKDFSSQHNFPRCVNASGIWTWNYIPSRKDLITQWPSPGREMLVFLDCSQTCMPSIYQLRKVFCVPDMKPN